LMMYVLNRGVLIVCRDFTQTKCFERLFELTRVGVRQCSEVDAFEFRIQLKSDYLRVVFEQPLQCLVIKLIFGCSKQVMRGLYAETKRADPIDELFWMQRS